MIQYDDWFVIRAARFLVADGIDSERCLRLRLTHLLLPGTFINGCGCLDRYTAFISMGLIDLTLSSVIFTSLFAVFVGRPLCLIETKAFVL